MENQPLDGVIKFNLDDHKQAGPLDQALIEELESYRSKLFNLELIGEYKVLNLF